SQINVTGTFGSTLANNGNAGPAPTGDGGGPTGGFFQAVTDVQAATGPGLFGGQGAAGVGNAVYMVHVDINATLLADGQLSLDLPLVALEAPLGGDVVSVVATLADGQPLPSWLHFDGATGKFAGLVPDDILTGSIPGNGGVNGSGPGNDGGSRNGGAQPPAATLSDELMIKVIARDSKGNISILEFPIKLAPGTDGDHHTLNLPDLLHAAASAKVWTQHAQDLALAPMRHGEIVVHGGALHEAAGRAGLSAQLDSLGWRGMHAQRMALLESLRSMAAGR
ncbi:MAG: hypothetical protein JO258_06150, partial [Alphaproteobacteria bacterium]|nr:hypothetical protein [Alphaproteobacteria bacterium]